MESQEEETTNTACKEFTAANIVTFCKTRESTSLGNVGLNVWGLPSHADSQLLLCSPQVTRVKIFLRRGIGPALVQAFAHQIDEALKALAVDGPVTADDALSQIFVDGGARVLERSSRAPAHQLGGLLPVGMRLLHCAHHRLEIAHRQLAVGLGPAAVDDQAMKTGEPLPRRTVLNDRIVAIELQPFRFEHLA